MKLTREKLAAIIFLKFYPNDCFYGERTVGTREKCLDLADLILSELAKEKPNEEKAHRCPFHKTMVCYEHYNCNGCNAHNAFLSEKEKPETLGEEEIKIILQEMNYGQDCNFNISMCEIDKIAYALAGKIPKVEKTEECIEILKRLGYEVLERDAIGQAKCGNCGKWSLPYIVAPKIIQKEEIDYIKISKSDWELIKIILHKSGE